MRISREQGPVPVFVFSLQGDLDAESSGQIELEIREGLCAGTCYALIDLGGVRYLSSAGLRLLHRLNAMLTRKAAEGQGSKGAAVLADASFKSPYLKLLNPSRQLAQVLSVTGFDLFLDVFYDLPTAIAAFGPRANDPDAALDALRRATPEAEARRLDLLRGRRLLMVMGSYPGKRPMYERAKELGIKLVVLDGPGHWAQAAAREGLFEQFIEVDLAPPDTLADRAFQAVQASGLRFDGIANMEELAGPLTALLAQRLGLPGHPVLAVAYARNKIFTREVCIEAGIPSPRFARIQSADDLERAAAHVGFPAVLKPVSGVASNSTYRVDDSGMLRQRYAQIVASVRGHLKTAGVHSDNEDELIWAAGLDMTLEEFLDGEEFDIDCLLSEGRMVYASVSRDLPQLYLTEVASQTPPAFPDDKQAEMVQAVGNILHVLGFADGVFHVEMKYTSQGPRLIEVNARVGGGAIWEHNRRVWGVDLAEQYFMTRLDIPIRPAKATQPMNHLITSYLLPPYSGTLEHTDFLAPILGDPRVVKGRIDVKAGDRVVGPDTAVPRDLGLLMVCGDSVEEAAVSLDELLAKVTFPIVRDAA